MISSKQASCVRQLIDRSLHAHGDIRIADAVAVWWADDFSNILMLEGQDLAEDTTAACVLLYFLASCNKMIYTFNVPTPTTAITPLAQFIEMLRTLTQSLLSLRGSNHLITSWQLHSAPARWRATAQTRLRRVCILSRPTKISFEI
ncbi:hypothetical protein B0H66DRAFT_553753 [Apodospora peruviana]|uniref:Uncharacterized protein n=1 Tax=Apodospora peruviana TaxID=516989 RepID=A0AAE0IBT2_9PEZI|nr:hypothetical protein B0H66DRAFT_553753 [Apodospora peruviana]